MPKKKSASSARPKATSRKPKPNLDGVTIVTDNKWKDFLYGSDLPKKALEDFDWMDPKDYGVDRLEDVDGFMKRKNNYYHTSEFMHGGMPGWDGSHGESFFSGILMKYSPDGEQYKIAYYHQ